LRWFFLFGYFLFGLLLGVGLFLLVELRLVVFVGFSLGRLLLSHKYYTDLSILRNQLMYKEI
jgi:hypothetical protein